MALPNSEKITSQLASMPDQALKQMAMMHKADPYVLPLIIAEDGRRKQVRSAAMARMAAPQPKVNDAAVASVGSLPEDQGIAQLQTPNIQHMADGGIAGYDDASLVANNEPVLRMAGGGMKKMSGAELFERALDMEGITDPKERAFLKALHGQESSGKATAKTSNRDAYGAMQIRPGTFKQVADADMDINKPLDNMRAGIRYGKKGFDAAGGDPVLAGAYYYGGPGGMQKAAKGVAVSDPENPKAPTTLEYGKSIAQRMTDLLPIGSAVAEEVPKKAPVLAKKPGLENARDTAKATGAAGLTGLMAPGAVVSAVDAGNSLFQKFGHQPANIGPMQPPQALTTAQKLGRFFGAAAVPQTVLAGGMAASNKAMSDLDYMSPEQRHDMFSNPMLSAMSGDAGIAAAIRDAAANNPKGPSQMPYKEQMTNVAKAIVQHPDIDRMREKNKAKEEAEAIPKQLGMVPVSPDEFGSAVGIPEPVQEKAVEVAKEALPEKKGFSFDNEDLLSLGLRLMANKSKDLLTAAGEAGIGALSDKKEREKAATEKAYKESQTKYQTAYADAIERGAKEKNEQLQAETLIQNAMANWDKNNKIISIQDPTARMREEERIRQQVYANLGIKPIMTAQAAPAGGGDFKMIGVRG